MGFQGARRAYGSAYFGPGTGPIWLDNLQCADTESRLEDCPNKGWRVNDCTHDNDAGVECFSGKLNVCNCKFKIRFYAFMFQTDYGCPPNGTLRLTGSDYYMGRAEICEDEEYTCFCGDSFTRQHGELICLQLGFSGLYRYSTGPSECTEGGVTDIECPQDAMSFEDCIYTVNSRSCPQVFLECYSKFIN